MKCPNCGKVQHWTCGNKKCACFTVIPSGEKPQKSHFDWAHWWRFQRDDTAQYDEMMVVKAMVLGQYAEYKRSGFTPDESLALIEGGLQGKSLFFVPITRLWCRLSEVSK